MFVLDNSGAGAYAQCSTQGILRYGLGYTALRHSAALIAGHAGHEALDVFLKLGATEEAAKHALARYAVEYLKGSDAMGEGENFEPEPRLSLENTSAVLETWFGRNQKEQLLFDLEGASFEQEVAVEMGAGLTFLGRLDGIARSKLDGKWYVIEHKTTGTVNSYWSSQWHTSSQVTGYMWAASRIIGEPVVGCFVNAIEFSVLPSDQTRKCKTHGTVYAECGKEHAKGEWIITTRAPWQIAQWERDFWKLAKRFEDELDAVRKGIVSIENLPMQGTFTGACRFCDFKDFCGMGRGEKLVGLLLRKDPWKLSVAGMEKLAG